MKKYPSIEQFRQVVRQIRQRHDFKGKDELGNAVYSHTAPYPTISFVGTVKLHGTNAGIVKYTDRVEFQSRERVLSDLADNAGFHAAMRKLSDVIAGLFKDISFTEYAAIYGEWCGGNIQPGVAIAGLPKMFVIFGLQVDGMWIELPEDLHYNDASIYNIKQFPSITVDIDFNQPELIQNKLIEHTLAIEECCPVGQYFGVNGVGEGIVFTQLGDPSVQFKSKGEKHSVSKVTKLNAVDVERLASMNAVIDATVTENRLLQGLSSLRDVLGRDLSTKDTGSFISWIMKDIEKEDLDVVEASGFSVKDLGKGVATKARIWFLVQDL